jgi:hypothetical protein
MIDKEKLREFLIRQHHEAYAHAASAGGSEHYYQLGQAHALAKIIAKLDNEEFGIEKEPAARER